jgi:hypothetical protein
MSCFLYYLPAAASATDEILDGLGLAGVLEGARVARPVMNNGPDGGAGLVVTAPCLKWGGVESRIGYYPDKQRWRKAPGGGYWIGYETAARPRRVDLQRDIVIAGHDVRLTDGASWVIPLARRIDGGTNLDCAFSLDDAGEWVETPLAKYDRLREIAGRAWATVLNEKRIEERAAAEMIDETELVELAVEVLSTNYRVGRLEVAELELLTRMRAIEIMAALVDVPALEEFQQEIMRNDAGVELAGKKKEP